MFFFFIFKRRFGRLIAGLGLLSAGFGLLSAGFGLLSAGFGLLSAGFGDLSAGFYEKKTQTAKKSQIMTFVELCLEYY